jgi:NADP-dependent 3-hydroxy acid dehydrogenase YdfG
MKVFAEPCDATNEASVGKLFAKVKQEIGELDVLIANVGAVTQPQEILTLGKKPPQYWWADIETNIKGTYLAIHSYINTFTSNDENATGTIIVMSSGSAILPLPGMSSYGPSKVFTHRLLDYVLAEHPKMRTFSLSPGIIPTTDIPKQFIPFAKDTVELVGGFSLWLNTPKADFLSGTWLYVNWDVEELVQHKEEIVAKGLLKTKFVNAELKEGGHPFEG